MSCQSILENWGISEEDLLVTLLKNEPIAECFARALRLSPELHQLSQTCKRINQIVKNPLFIKKCISTLSPKQINWVFTWYKSKLRLTIFNCDILRALLLQEAKKINLRKKPVTGFVLFINLCKKDLTSNNARDHFKIVAGRWKKLSEKERDKFRWDAQHKNRMMANDSIFQYPAF